MIFTKWKMNEPAPPELMHPCEDFIEKHTILFLSCSGYWEKSKERALIPPISEPYDREMFYPLMPNLNDSAEESQLGVIKF